MFDGPWVEIWILHPMLDNYLLELIVEWRISRNQERWNGWQGCAIIAIVVMAQTKPDFSICGVLCGKGFGELGIQGVNERRIQEVCRYS